MLVGETLLMNRCSLFIITIIVMMALLIPIIDSKHIYLVDNHSAEQKEDMRPFPSRSRRSLWLTLRRNPYNSLASSNKRDSQQTLVQDDPHAQLLGMLTLENAMRHQSDQLLSNDDRQGNLADAVTVKSMDYDPNQIVFGVDAPKQHHVTLNTFLRGRRRGFGENADEESSGPADHRFRDVTWFLRGRRESSPSSAENIGAVNIRQFLRGRRSSSAAYADRKNRMKLLRIGRSSAPIHPYNTDDDVQEGEATVQFGRSRRSYGISQMHGLIEMPMTKKFDTFTDVRSPELVNYFSQKLEEQKNASGPRSRRNTDDNEKPTIFDIARRETAMERLGIPIYLRNYPYNIG